MEEIDLEIFIISMNITNAPASVFFVYWLNGLAAAHFFFFSLNVYTRLNKKLNYRVLFEKCKCQMCTLKSSCYVTVLRMSYLCEIHKANVLWRIDVGYMSFPFSFQYETALRAGPLLRFMWVSKNRYFVLAKQNRY